jgi:hypothetical protein
MGDLKILEDNKDATGIFVGIANFINLGARKK